MVRFCAQSGVMLRVVHVFPLKVMKIVSKCSVGCLVTHATPITARAHLPPPYASARLAMLATICCEAARAPPFSKRKRCPPPATLRSSVSMATTPREDFLYTLEGVTAISRRAKCATPTLSASQSSGDSDLAVSSVVYMGNMRRCAADSPRLVSSRSRRRWSTHAKRAEHSSSARSSQLSEQ